MVATCRVEWIGVRSPKDDARVMYRKLNNLLNPDQLARIEAISQLVLPMIRHGRRHGRLLTTRMGYSRTYAFGPGSHPFVHEMTEADAKRLFISPDEAEFRNLDNPDHDDRVPVVPVHFFDKVMRDLWLEIENGPGVALVGVNGVNTVGDVQDFRADRQRPPKMY